jgi:ribosomal protein S18 acetylase RimI-like enzyme
MGSTIVGRKIFTAIQGKVNMNSVFATVRVDNQIMVFFLKKYGFAKLGHSYQSKRGNYQLECYVPKHQIKFPKCSRKKQVMIKANYQS